MPYGTIEKVVVRLRLGVNFCRMAHRSRTITSSSAHGMFRLVAACAAAWLPGLCFAVDKLDPDSATHKAAQSITAQWEGHQMKMSTFAMSPDRHLWLCCAANHSASEGSILITDRLGHAVRQILLPIQPSAIAFSRDHGNNWSAFVAGGGKLLKLDQAGSVLHSIDSPNIGDREEALEKLRQQARQQAADLVAGVEQQRERIQSQIDELTTKAKDPDSRIAARATRRLKLLKQQENQIEQILESVISGDAGVTEASLDFLMRASGLAVTDQYVFVALPSVSFSYEVWRLDHDLTDPQKVLENGRGCCGQYDIQTDGISLVVAENCNFQVAYYDLDGNPLQKFGSRSETQADGFGSCCNPMNICCEGDDVLTAESSIGHIKRFSATGEFLEYIGKAPIGGGCKHVAIAHDSETDRYFMYNQDRNCLNVLVPKSEVTEETDQERSARLAMTSLNQQLVGRWEIISDETNGSPLLGFLSQKFSHFDFQPDGVLADSSLSVSLSASTPVMAALTKLSGSEEAAALLMQPAASASWMAIEHQKNVYRLGFVENGVHTFEADVEFLDRDTISATFMYSSPEPIGTLRYSRSATTGVE